MGARLRGSFLGLSAFSFEAEALAGFAGAGASTKILLRDPIRKEGGKEANLVRAENVNNINDYIARIDEMIERKEKWLWR